MQECLNPPSSNAEIMFIEWPQQVVGSLQVHHTAQCHANHGVFLLLNQIKNVCLELLSIQASYFEN